MRNQWLKYLLIGVLLISIINRGLFVVSPEAESFVATEVGNGEINSLFEFLHKIITGYENDIDEDGNSPESYNFAKIAQPLIDHSLMQAVELKSPVFYISKKFFSLSESILSSPIYGTVDHPPEIA